MAFVDRHCVLAVTLPRCSHIGPYQRSESTILQRPRNFLFFFANGFFEFVTVVLCGFYRKSGRCRLKRSECTSGAFFYCRTVSGTRVCVPFHGCRQALLESPSGKIGGRHFLGTERMTGSDFSPNTDTSDFPTHPLGGLYTPPPLPRPCFSEGTPFVRNDSSILNAPPPLKYLDTPPNFNSTGKP